MASVRKTSKARNNRGLSALYGMTQATALEHFTPSAINTLSKTHPMLRSQIQNSGALTRHKKEWIIRWMIPHSDQDIINSGYFVTVAPTDKIALQHFILADTADQSVIGSMVNYDGLPTYLRLLLEDLPPRPNRHAISEKYRQEYRDFLTKNLQNIVTGLYTLYVRSSLLDIHEMKREILYDL